MVCGLDHSGSQPPIYTCTCTTAQYNPRQSFLKKNELPRVGLEPSSPCDPGVVVGLSTEPQDQLRWLSSNHPNAKPCEFMTNFTLTLYRSRNSCTQEDCW